MGINWSSEEEENEREDKAAEALHELVWDRSNAIGATKVEKILTRHEVTSLNSVKRVQNLMKDAQADQIRKTNAYKKNQALDWAEFHSSISCRYSCVIHIINSKLFPASPVAFSQTLEEEPS